MAFGYCIGRVGHNRNAGQRLAGRGEAVHIAEIATEQTADRRPVRQGIGHSTRIVGNWTDPACVLIHRSQRRCAGSHRCVVELRHVDADGRADRSGRCAARAVVAQIAQHHGDGLCGVRIVPRVIGKCCQCSADFRQRSCDRDAARIVAADSAAGSNMDRPGRIGQRDLHLALVGTCAFVPGGFNVVDAEGGRRQTGRAVLRRVEGGDADAQGRRVIERGHAGVQRGAGRPLIGLAQMRADVGAAREAQRRVGNAYRQRTGRAVVIGNIGKEAQAGVGRQQQRCCIGRRGTGAADRDPASTRVVLPDALRRCIGRVAHHGNAAERAASGAVDDGVGAV